MFLRLNIVAFCDLDHKGSTFNMNYGYRLTAENQEVIRECHDPSEAREFMLKNLLKIVASEQNLWHFLKAQHPEVLTNKNLKGVYVGKQYFPYHKGKNIAS